jgi:hypothetical protein
MTYGILDSSNKEGSRDMKNRTVIASLLILTLAATGTASISFLLMPTRDSRGGETIQDLQVGANSQVTSQNDTAIQHFDWTLVVDGLVQHPLNLSFAEIAVLPKSTVNATLICVDFPDAPLAGGNWTGVDLAYLLQQAGVEPTAVKVAFYAIDGYTTDLTIQTAMSKVIIVAYQNNGVPITEGLRLVVPGTFGYKWISKLARIELVNYDFKGKWESAGYSDDGLGSYSPRPTQTPPSPPPSQPSPSPTPSPSPQPSPSQPNNPPVTPPPSNNLAEPQQGFLGTSLPMEYGYAMVALIVLVVVAATGYLYYKRRK